MTTKPPPSTAPFPESALENIAYASVKGISGREPNDVNRLGYSVWAWLKERKGTLEDAVKSSGIRTEMGTKEIAELVREELRSRGVGGV